MADPSVGVDLDGNLFVCGFYRPSAVEFVVRSTDGGATWNPTVVATTFPLDKPSVTINTNAGTPHENHIYFAYSDWATVPGPIKFSRSTDGGQNFSTPVSISGSVGLGRHVGVKHLAVSPDSGLYATWVGFDSLRESPSFFHLGFNQSSDGGISWATPRELDTLNKILRLFKGGREIYSVNKASIDVDRSSGARRGWIYIVYAETTSTSPDIFLIRSTDAGSSWSSAQKVNQDNSGKDSWLPIFTVDQATGDLYVVYYDSRNFPANDSAEVYISVSTDGGQTFGDILVSDVPFLPRPLIRNDAGRAYMGSYIGISALQGIVWPCWMDNRTGIHQAYTSRVVFSDTSAPPMIGVSPETLDFGNVFVDSSKTLGLYVRNRVFSPDTLFVTDIHSDSATFTPDITSFSLPGANSRKVNIAFNPLSVGLKTATLTITSNDTAHPVVTVALRAYVLPITPTLVSPPNGAINQPITPTLIWTSTGASSYHLQVSTSSSFTTTVYDNSTIADTSRQIGPLAGLTRYYWKVSAKVNEVNSPYSQSRYFFTGIAPPSPPILASPANDTTNQPTTLTLHWNASALASTYHLQVSTDSTFAAPFLEDSSLTSTSRQVGGLASETKYFWRVQAKNSGGISDWSSVWNFTTGAREVTRQFTVGDRWNIISLPVQVDNNLKQNLFPTAASNAFAYEGTAGYMQKDTLLEGSGYWIKFGATQTISITGVPITSDSIAVGEGWNLIGSISEPIAAAQVFSIPSGLITSQFFGYQGVYVVSDTIQPGKGYWVKVSQTGKLILSSSSLARASNRIRIVPTSELPPPPPDGEITNLQSQIPSHFALEQNYPNPFNPSTIIRYQLPVTGYVTLKVYNVLGQEVATLVNEVKQPGRYSVEWNGSGHPSGVYLYRLHVRKFSETKKLLLVK